MATKIILSRKSEFMNRARGFKVFIDGAETGAVSNGGSEEYLVEPGTHTVETRISWYSSRQLTVNVNEGETKFLKVRSAMKYFGVFYVLIIVAIVADLVVRRSDMPKPEWWIWLKLAMVIPFIVYFLYYLIFARKKYLLLEEDNQNIFR